MSSGGISTHQQNAGAQNLPPGVAGAKGQTQAVKAKSAAHIGRGFSTSNSISHQEGRSKAQAAASRDRTVRLPQPNVDPARVVTPEMQAQISQTLDTTEMMFTLDELLNQLSVEETEEQGEEGSTLGSSVYGTTGKRKSGQGQQGGDGMGRNPGGQQDPAAILAAMGGAKLAEAAESPQQLLKLQGDALDVLDKIMAIESAPPELMAELKADSARLSHALVNGDIEDVARILSEIQTKIQDTRIKFDEQAIRTGRLKRQQLSQERIQKLGKALEKLKEAKKKALIGKIFGGIATALMVIVAAVTIATGVGAKAGLMLIMAATIMVAMTVSQNTGDWMTTMGGAIKDEKAQLAMGIMWALLAAALSFGSGFAGGASKAAADTGTTAVQQSANATAQASQQSAQASATAAQQSANASSQAAQQSAQHSATVAQQSAKTATKAATEVADDAAQQSTKVAVKAAKESGQSAAKETTKETAKQMADITKKEMYFRRAKNIAQFTQGAATAAEGGSSIDATVTRHKGEMYQADAQEELAWITRIQQQMEDWMEAIQRVLQEIGEGQQIASDMLSQAQQNKFTITRNI